MADGVSKTSDVASIDARIRLLTTELANAQARLVALKLDVASVLSAAGAYRHIGSQWAEPWFP
jgi:hypothetical protein